MSGNGANGSGNGTEQHSHEPVLGDIPAEILERAESCRQYALSALGVELDYEPETLPVLDEYLRIAASGVKDRPEALPLVTRAVAAYFGEVVRRRIDGFWRHLDDASDDWQLCARRVFLSVSPLGMVLESLEKSPDHSGPSGELILGPDDRELAERRVAVLPPVSEEEYYLLSTRLEVIETIYEALRDQMKSEGRESLVFEESDYEE